MLNFKSRFTTFFKRPSVFSLKPIHQQFLSARQIGTIIVQDFLNRKENVNVHCISSEASVREAAIEMENYKIGALMVTLEHDSAAGIVTARDIQKAVATKFDTLGNVKVKDIMTPASRLEKVHPRDNLLNVADLMVAKNIRHIPVIHNDKNVGILSIKDVVSEVLEQERIEKAAMESIITDSYSAN